MLYCFTVRLVDGSTKYDGRVEVYHNGVWATVCDDRWGTDDAQVVCNALDYGKAVAAGHNKSSGQSSDNLHCVSADWTIVNCSHGGWRFHICHRGAYVSVNCTAGMYTDNKFILCINFGLVIGIFKLMHVASI